MKIMGLKQLQAGNPSLYDPIAIDTAALQAMGWSNPSQFMVPPSSLQNKPPPEVQYAQAMVQIKKQEADAKTAMVGVKQQEVAAKMQESQGAQGAQGPTIEDQIKMAELQARQQEMQMDEKDSMMDAINRKRDRESRERLAAVKLAETIATVPGAEQAVQSLLDPGMIQRLESNEQPLTES
jgi:hypothetical protein